MELSEFLQELPVRPPCILILHVLPSKLPESYITGKFLEISDTQIEGVGGLQGKK